MKTEKWGSTSSHGESKGGLLGLWEITTWELNGNMGAKYGDHEE
jgi:hypothetical protein